MKAAILFGALSLLQRTHGRRKLQGGTFTPAQLAARWKSVYTLGTLANWRSAGRGPNFIKVAGRVLYTRAAVEAFERAKLAEYVR
ncbi:hypothetical protein [Paraburkholderia sp.]|uniref:hypothetical protein n=1 Tax=Paraburkholderia sp. TaxID=1926495 RepID=UPI002D37DE21|nr:hypothetical protein [Paraburkholderia sp.]HZZ06303.1 hypothetical protein [Paraburkholderia sp.]